MRLSTPTSDIPKIGPVYVKRLKKIGIQTIGDLLFHFPSRYIDFSEIKKIADLKINEIACIKGNIEKIENQTTFKRHLTITKAVIKDKSGIISVTWFNQPYLVKTLKINDKVCLAGRISISKEGAYLSNPAYEKISSPELENLKHTARLVPIYIETRGISSRWIRYIIKPLLEKTKDRIPETLPEKIIKEQKLLLLKEALYQIHFPKTKKMAEQAKRRFAFEELFLLELFVLRKKAENSEFKAPSIPFNLDKTKDFVADLPFKLTKAQKKTSWQILKDLEKQKPMNRLLQGDVGSGKTVVASLAALNVIKNGYQVAFMAPTEILSKQHFQTLAIFFKNAKIEIGLLTSKTDKIVSKKLKRQNIEISRKKLLEKTLNGKIDILIGTHSLIQDKVKFGNLAFVVLDEQHRFGVKQRAKLCQKEKDIIPHLLSMTATPIPRSLALTIYGDLDLSLIDEMPKGKRKVETRLILETEREKAYQIIKKEIKKGNQAFVICPRIEKKEENENNSWSEVKTVKQEFENLSKKIFPQFRIAILHSKVPATEKNQIMKNFQKGKIDILVSTSVVEVGIDIPKATVMLIEDADRFGLAQLHQFRGRIGRKGNKSYCLLFSKKASSRLKALVKIQNGLELAEKDLKIRGPGQFLGTKQWGLPDVAMSALDNLSLVEIARETAKEILQGDIELKKNPILKKRVQKFQQKIHLE
jgi:ATP-dependent DNA helicase RecG